MDVGRLAQGKLRCSQANLSGQQAVCCEGSAPNARPGRAPPPATAGSSAPPSQREGQERPGKFCKKNIFKTSESNEGNAELRSEKKKSEGKDPSYKRQLLTTPVEHVRSEIFTGLEAQNGVNRCIVSGHKPKDPTGRRAKNSVPLLSTSENRLNSLKVETLYTVFFKTLQVGTSLAVPWLRLRLPVRGCGVDPRSRS